MIGNDIVDYTIDEEKYLNQRYVSRCLSQLESKYLQQSCNKNAFFWSLWACKEAGYKAYQQQQVDCIFSPPKFELSQATLTALLTHDMRSDFRGEIIYQSIALALQLTWPTNHVVHCVAAQNLDVINNSYTAIERNAAAINNLKQSELTRALAQQLLKNNDIQATIERPELNMGHYKKPGPPILIDAATQEKRTESISLSHDNFWLAFVVSGT